MKFWLKRDFTNCAYMSQSLYFIAKVSSGVYWLGDFYFPSVFVSAQENCFKCGSPRASEFQGNLKRLSPRKPDTQAKLCRVGQVNAESLACQRHKKQLDKDNSRCSCHMHGTASDKSKLSKIPITLLSLR